MLLFVLILIVILCFAYMYWTVTKRYNYWKEKKVPYVKPLLIFGNYKDYILLKEYAPKITQKICQEFKNLPYVGTYYGTDPALVVKDPELIKLVITKDFNYFSGREQSDFMDCEQLTQHIFFMKEVKWKVVRKNLSPLFSNTKIKNMFYLVQDCTKKLETFIEDEIKMNSVIDVKSLSSRYTMDCIASCAFGINTETLNKKIQDNSFITIGHKIFSSTNYRCLQLIMRSMWPALFYKLGFRIFSPELYTFFHAMMSKVFESRRSIVSTRNDFVDQMLKWKEKDFLTENTNDDKAEPVLKVDDKFLAAQCMMLFAAGFDTTASTLSLTLYELAKNPIIQMKVIEEVDAYNQKYSGNIQFDHMQNELSFLEACVNEVLRMYPVLGMIPREVVKNYTFPTGLKLEKGIRIHIPVYHLHYNQDYFPDPESFRPERFFGKQKANVIPYTYLPFGEGPRICLGQQFSKANLFAGLIAIFKNYQLEIGTGTPEKLEFDVKAIFTTKMKGDINLKFMPRISSNTYMGNNGNNM